MPGNGFGREQAVEHRRLRRVDDGREVVVQRRPVDRCLGRWPDPVAARRPVAAAKKISPLPWCAVLPVRASPSPARRASRLQAGGVERAVGERPRRCTSLPVVPGAAAGRAAGSSRPTGTPSTVSRARSPKLVITTTPTVLPSGTSREDVPMPPLNPRQRHAGARRRRRPRAAARTTPRWLARALSAAADVVAAHLHPSRVGQEAVVALGDHRDDHVGVADRRRPPPSAARRPRRRPGRAASSRSGRSGSRAGPTRLRVRKPVHSPAPLRTAPPAGIGEAKGVAARVDHGHPGARDAATLRGCGLVPPDGRVPEPDLRDIEDGVGRPGGELADPDSQVSNARHRDSMPQ